jgi:succinate dehydrogenase/fumarate reductase flavoprotein subunit
MRRGGDREAAACREARRRRHARHFGVVRETNGIEQNVTRLEMT